MGLELRASRLLDSTQPVSLPTGNTKIYKLSQYLPNVDAQKLCTIIFPWGKNTYKCLPMGIKIAPDVSQNIMSKLIQDMEYVKRILHFDYKLIL